MPNDNRTESTDSAMLEALRYRKNKEMTMTDQEDERALEELADFMQATAEGINNPSLASKLRDIANQIIINKTDLVRGGMEPPEGATPAGQAPMSDEERLALMRQMAEQQGAGLPGGGGQIPPQYQ